MKLKAYSHNNPLKHLVLHTVKRYLWLPFVMLALSFTLFVGSEMFMENRMLRASSLLGDADYVFKNSELWELFPMFLVIFSAFAAYTMLSFVFKKKSSTMYMLTGVSRTKLYLTCYLYGLISTLLPASVCFIINLKMGAGNVNKALTLNKYTFMIIAMLVTLIVCSYTVAAIAISLCGRKLEFFAVCTIFVVGGLMLLAFIGILGNAFVHGFAYPIRSEEVCYSFSDMFEKYEWIALLTVFQNAFCDYSILGYNPEVVSFDVYSTRLLLLSAFTLALIPLSVWLFKRRNAEFDGKSNAHPCISFICSVVAALAVSALVLIDGGTLVNLLITLAVFTLLTMLFYAFFNGTAREILKSIRFVLPCTAAFAVLVLVLNFDLIGYSKKIPNIDDIESVTVSYKGKNDLDFHGSRSGTNHHIISSLPVLSSLPKLTSREDIEIAQRIHKKIIADASMIPSERLAENCSDTAVYVDYNIVYTLKNGREIVRSYSVMKLSTLYSTLEIEHTSAYRERLDTTVLAGFGTPYYDESGELIVHYDRLNFFASDNMLSNASKIELSDAEKAELLKAISADKREESYESAYHPAEDCMGVLWYLEPNPLSDGTMGSAPYVAVYKHNKNILAFLKAKGYEDIFNTSYEIKSVRLYSYNYYGRSDVREMAIDRSFTSFYNYNYFERPEHGYYNSSEIFFDLGEAPKAEWDNLLNNSYLVYFRDCGNKYAVITLKNANGEERVVTKFIPQ